MSRRVVEASTPPAITSAPADAAIRADVDELLAKPPLVGVLRRALVTANIHDRRELLDGVRAILADAAAPLLRAAGTREIVFVLGHRGPAFFLPPSLAAAAAATGLPAMRIAPAYGRARAQAGRLGLRGVRWLLDDPEFFLALAAGLLDAAQEEGVSRVSVLLPAVSFAGELAAANRLLEGAAKSAEKILRVHAGIECVRGVLELAAIEAHAAFTEIDLRALTETAFGLAKDDAPGLLPENPFESLDGVLASLIAGTPAGTCERRVRTNIPPPVGRGQGEGAEPPRLDVVAAPAARPLPAPEVTGRAEVHVASLVSSVEAGTLSRGEALARVTPEMFDALRARTLDTRGSTPLAVGMGVSPGCGAGRIALSTDAAEAFRRAGESYVLVVREVYGEEARFVRSAAALVSGRGGRTSHAALVAAEAGVPCVMHEQLRLEHDAAVFEGRSLHEGDALSVDGATGELHAGRLPVREAGSAAASAAILRWADETRRLRVLVNADTPEGIRAGLDAGADGVGLVRIENLFFEPERLALLRRILVGRADAAAFTRLETLLRGDFAVRLDAAGDRPITFRLLDASYEEFLPRDRRACAAFADALGIPLAEAAALVDAVRPVDPGLSVRASRLSRKLPELEAIQVRALAAAWLALPLRAEARGPAAGSRGSAPRETPLKILVPMISGADEMAAAATRIRAHAPPGAEIGAMVELPRAALDAAALARHADFFAWGTNDLTQYATGLGRALFPRVVPRLQDLHAISDDPSATLDLAGVGRLLAHAERAGKSARPSLVTGVCGGLGADPRSIAVFAALGLDYVSVPPSHVARVRLAAARSANHKPS